MLARLRAFLSFCLPKRASIWFTLWVIWWVVLWYLSSQPAAAPLPTPYQLDKVAHFGYFGIGGALLAGYISSHSAYHAWSSRRIQLTVWMMGVFLGALDEFHQSFIPGRSGNDPGDWFADHLGAVCGAFCILWVIRFVGNEKHIA